MATTRTGRVLMGCGIGCGVLLLLGVGSCVGFAVWINTPGDVLDPGALVGEDTLGYIEWTLRLEDPGTREMVDRFLGTLEDAPGTSSMLPPILGDRLAEYQNRRNQQKLEKLFPLVAVWTVRPGETDDTDLHLLSASLRGLDHQLVLVDWIMGFVMPRAEEAQTVRHRGEKIYLVPFGDDERDVAFFIRDGDLFFTADVETSRIAVDRLLTPETVSPGPVDAWLGQAPQLPLRGALSNARGELRRIWEEHLDGDVLPEGAWEAVRGLTLGGEFSEDSALQIEVRMHMIDRSAAEAAEPVLRTAIRRALGETPVELRSTEVEAERIVFRFVAEGLAEQIGTAAEPDQEPGD